MKSFTILLPLFLISCVTRIKTPLIEGNVYTINNKPLTDVKVCLGDECVKTNKDGFFTFKRKTYMEFITIGGEAPPVFFNLNISKVTYNDTIISYFNKYGGGNTNLKVEYQNIILKSNL